MRYSRVFGEPVSLSATGWVILRVVRKAGEKGCDMAVQMGDNGVMVDRPNEVYRFEDDWVDVTRHRRKGITVPVAH